MIVLGIDPGQKGAIAVLREGATAVAHPFDEERYLSVMHNCVIESHGNIVACVEEVHSMPKQGVASTFSFGRNFGFILGMLYANHIKTVMVSPRRWKGFFVLGHDKKDSIDLAKKFYPDADLYATPRCKTMHDGMAEAILIARYYKASNAV